MICTWTVEFRSNIRVEACSEEQACEIAAEQAKLPPGEYNAVCYREEAPTIKMVREVEVRHEARAT